MAVHLTRSDGEGFPEVLYVYPLQWMRLIMIFYGNGMLGSVRKMKALTEFGDSDTEC
jgi:hypothetical protein